MNLHTSKFKKIGFFILKIAISSALLYAVLSQTGIRRVVSLLSNINPLSFISAVFIYILAQFIASLRWRLLLPERFPISRLFSLYLLGSFFNIFLPGLVGGDAVKAYYLYKETGKGSQALGSVFMDRYIGYICLMVVGLIAFPFGIKYLRGSWIEWLLPLIVLCFLLSSIIIFGLRIGKRFKLLHDFYGYFHLYRRKKVIIAKTLLLSAVAQSIVIISVYILSLGLGQNIRADAFFIFLPIIVTLSALPISISGIGIREASFVLLFGFLGVKPEVATAISFAWFLSISIGGLAGIYEYLRHKDYSAT